MRAAHANGNGHGKSLDIEMRRLPTPRARDAQPEGQAAGERRMDLYATGTLSTVLALLPTPTTRDTKGANQRGDDTCLTGALLPTPRATDGTKGGPNQRGSSGDLMLPSAVAMLLPTPTVRDQEGSGGNRHTGGKHGPTLVDATVRQEKVGITWGDYADSIARAEAAFGPAPEPTETIRCHCGSKVKSRRLSCCFDEWLMGLPAGWVTDVPGVTHAEALKLCGNGVVPAQAALALRICLDRVERVA